MIKHIPCHWRDLKVQYNQNSQPDSRTYPALRDIFFFFLFKRKRNRKTEKTSRFEPVNLVQGEGTMRTKTSGTQIISVQKANAQYSGF